MLTYVSFEARILPGFLVMFSLPSSECERGKLSLKHLF